MEIMLPMDSSNSSNQWVDKVSILNFNQVFNQQEVNTGNHKVNLPELSTHKQCNSRINNSRINNNHKWDNHKVMVNLRRININSSMANNNMEEDDEKIKLKNLIEIN